ncbi:MAG: arylsulfatase A-like enzyme [Cyclobacteriaceae bacterium]|jgi:arylsulfatase
MDKELSQRVCILLGIILLLNNCNYKINDEKPNILLIMVDDMGYSDIGCYGGEIQTPNLDKLASEGIRFTRYYNTAKCFPSRACLLTGQYAQHNGMSQKATKFTNAVTIAEVLRESGYRTLMTGKHHGEVNPYYFGFDRYFGLKDGSCNHFNPGLQRNGEVLPAHKKGKFQPREWGIDSTLHIPYTPPEKDFYTTDYFTNYSINYLEEYKDEDKPFFMYVAYTAPHDPLMAWPEDQQKYFGKYMGGYEAIRKKRFNRQKEMGLIDKNYPLSAPTYEDWEALSRDDKLMRDSIMSTHAAMVDRVDQNIGRILDKLEELDKLDNTLILFMSDNGAQSQSSPNSWLWANGKNSDFSQPIGSMGRYTSLSLSWANVSNTPFRLYKSNSHEGGISSPLIIYWKGKVINPGSINDFPSHLIDIMPTILETTGASYPDKYKNEKINPVDGISLLPVIKGSKTTRSEPLFWQWQKGKAVRKEKWKLVSDNNEPWKLYNIETDQTETKNLINEFPEVANELASDWEGWINESGVTIKSK